jgi:hypothetical protein
VANGKPRTLAFTTVPHTGAESEKNKWVSGSVLSVISNSRSSHWRDLNRNQFKGRTVYRSNVQVRCSVSFL